MRTGVICLLLVLLMIPSACSQTTTPTPTLPEGYEFLIFTYNDTEGNERQLGIAIDSNLEVENVSLEYVNGTPVAVVIGYYQPDIVGVDLPRMDVITKVNATSGEMIMQDVLVGGVSIMEMSAEEKSRLFGVPVDLTVQTRTRRGVANETLGGENYTVDLTTENGEPLTEPPDVMRGTRQIIYAIANTATEWAAGNPVVALVLVLSLVVLAYMYGKRKTTIS